MNNRVSLSIILTVFLFTSCVPSVVNQEVNDSRKGSSDGAVANNVSTLNEGYGRVLLINPITLTGNKSLPASTKIASLLTSRQDFITENQFLIGNCDSVAGDCFTIRKDQNSDPLAAVQNRWPFDPDSQKDSWIQPHTYFHINKILSQFHTDLRNAQATGTAGVGLTGYSTALPFNLFSSVRHWRPGETFFAFPGCDFVNNARYEPATFSICLGFDSDFRTLKFAEDPSIIYHEFGHNMVQILMNIRNSQALGGADLGNLFYDEALSINEGLADFFSYYVNQRTHVFEWSLGRFSKASRPLVEGDPLHAPGIEEESDKRLSYPSYLNYDPNSPKAPIEDVHYAGMIASHFLVALGKDLQSYCSMTKTQSIYSLFWVLSETMSYLGDFTSKGNDFNVSDVVNLNSLYARDWFFKVNPINFRSFFQTYARFFNQVFGNTLFPRCTGRSHFPQDRLESLLDDYGLLLFDSYNEDGNGINGNDPAKTNKHITISNRKKSVLVSKDLLKIDPKTSAFVFDNRADMVGVYNSLQRSGNIGALSEQLASDLPFNNGNAKISPGELIGLSLNITNDSNSEIGGLQILANDWDHTKDKKPCNNFSDGWPLGSEGGVNDTGVIDPENNPGNCSYIQRSNDGPKLNSLDPVMPICFVQASGENNTSWVNQEEFRKQVALEKNLCLGGEDDTYNCFIRALKGADQAVFSRLAPKENFQQTLINPETQNFIFNSNNIILFEVSPWIPPGTSFRCRFRARFTNCSDCWMDENGEDFRDFDYIGPEPFKIIPFEFIVID